MYDEFGNQEPEDQYPESQDNTSVPEQRETYRITEPGQEDIYRAAKPVQEDVYRAAKPVQEDVYRAAKPVQEDNYRTSESVQEDVYRTEAEPTAEEISYDAPAQQSQSGYQHTQYYCNGQYHQREQKYQQGEQQYQNTAYRPVEPKKKNGSGMGMKLVLCAVMALIFGVVASAAFQISNYVGSALVAEETQLETRVELQQAEDVPPTIAEDNTDNKDNSGNTAGAVAGVVDISAVAENAMPSIVAITNKGVEEVQSFFFGETQYQETESTGSGVIIAKNDTELLIATNNHVVEGAEELSVCFTVTTENPEDAVVTAQVKGTDSDRDLAVVAVKLEDIPEDVLGKLKVAVMGDSDKVKVGTQVVAIGNALGYGQSVTVGYVSALNREVTIDNMSNYMIQTDAAINAGNSGGALLDTNGNLIGINSAKAADIGVEGMGYAIPINTASPILDELMNRTTRTKVTDAEEKGYLGVEVIDVSEEARQIYALPAGAFVSSVVEGSPAETAGIKQRDIITKLDGITITSSNELVARLEYYKAGETIDVVVKTAEGGEYKEHTVSVTLAKRPADGGNTSEKGSDSQNVPETEQPQEGYEYGGGYGYDDGYGYDGGYGWDDFFPW